MNKILFLLCVFISNLSFSSEGQNAVRHVLAAINKDKPANFKASVPALQPQRKSTIPPLAQAYNLKYSKEFTQNTREQISRALMFRGLKPKVTVEHKPELTVEHKQAVRVAAWNPNGETFVTGSQDGTIDIWHKNGKRIHSISNPAGVNSVCWSPDGTRVISGGDDKTVTVWDAKTGAKEKKIKFEEPVVRVAWHTNGNDVAVATNKTVSVFDRNDDWQQKKTEENLSDVRSLKWIPSTNFLLVAQYDNTVKLIKKKGRNPFSVNGFTADESISLSPDGTMFFRMNPLTLHDSTTKTKKFSLHGDHDASGFYIWAPFAWARDSSWVGIQNWNFIDIWNVQTGEKMHVLVHPKATEVSALDLRADGNAVLTAADDGQACVWQIDHLKDPEFHVKYDQLRRGELTPEQLTLLFLCNKYKTESYEICRDCLKVHETTCEHHRPAAVHLTEIPTKEQLPEVTVKECARVFLTFHPALREMIFNAFDRQDARQYVQGLQEFEQAKQSIVVPVQVENILEEYLISRRPVRARNVSPIEFVHMNIRDSAQKMVKERDAVAVRLFDALGKNDQDPAQFLNPLTINARSGKDNRTPFMHLLWMSRDNAFDKLFEIVLDYKAEFKRDEYHSETHQTDLGAQDYRGNTALMIAIKIGRFDYALKIAQKMNANKQLHKIFKMGGKETAFDLANKVKEEYAHNSDFVQLYSILEKHNAELLLGLAKVAKKVRNLRAKERRKYLMRR